jgi:hypothetical protein
MKRLCQAWFVLMAIVVGARLQAQTAEPLSFDPRTGFDTSPWVSARAAAMGEAIGPIANGPEAPYYNPAAIGGLHYKQARPALNQLHFPYLGLAADGSSLSLNKKLREGQNLQDPAVAEELLRAYDGDHPYARMSLVPSIGFNRSVIALIYDVRATSTPHGAGSDAIDIAYRSQTGPLVGFSFASPKRDFYLGVSAAYLERMETQGSFPLASVNETKARKEAFRSLKRTYTGFPVHVGGIWSFAADWRPAISLVSRNVTGTRFTPRNDTEAAYKDREDTTLGLSVSPNLARWGMLNVVVEATELGWSDKPWEDKLRLGSELTIGNGFGSEAGLSFRLGYRMAGICYGLGVNVGLVSFQAASYTEDIGLAGERVVERRSVLNIAINLAE